MDITFEMLKEAMLLRGWQYKEQLPPYAKGEMPYMFSSPIRDTCVIKSGDYWGSYDMVNFAHYTTTHAMKEGNAADMYTIKALYRIVATLDPLHWHVTYPSHHLGGNAVILAATKEDAIKCTCEGLNLANDIGMDAKVISLHLNKPVEIFNGEY